MEWKSLSLLWHYVEKWALEQPQGEALVFQDERLSWSDFKREMDLVAKGFLELGLGLGDRVAMLSMARNEFLTTYMAAAKVGAVWLGLNPKFTLEELRYQIDDCQPTVLISLREFQGTDLIDTLNALRREFPCIKALLVIGKSFDGALSFKEFVAKPRPELDAELARRATQVRPDADVLLMYTSGSTGKPKGVIHTHRSLVENIRVETEKFYIHQNSRALLHFPINHVAADVEIGFAAIMAGGCVVAMDAFDPVKSLQTVATEKITLFGQVPVMFLMQMKEPIFKEIDFSAVETFVWAGASAPKIMVDVLSTICAKTGATLITGYGSTEVAGFVTYTEKGDDQQTLMKTAGKIAPPFELKIVDDQRQELRNGEIGEIAVRGPFMFKGYLNRPDETAQVLDQEGWYYTNDLAWMDERGYITITGRKSEMFKTGGENVYPREIEEVLELHDNVLFAAVIAAPDEIYQEVGWAYIMPKPGKTVVEDELRTLCQAKLANYKIPKKFFIRPILPLLPTGKVNKVELQKEVK